MGVEVKTTGGHGGPPLHLRQGSYRTVNVNVGAALRGRPT